jgi:hypothetical protein
MELKSLTNFGEGVEIAEFANELSVFQKTHPWSFRLRRAPLLRPTNDAERIALELATLAHPPADAVKSYLQRLPHGAVA